MDTDSFKFDAAEELLPPYPGKHRTTDRDVGPSKSRKYDENYIDLGFTYIGSSAFPQPQCVAHVQRHYLTSEWNLLSCINNKVTDTINKKKGLDEIYMLSYRVASPILFWKT